MLLHDTSDGSKDISQKRKSACTYRSPYFYDSEREGQAGYEAELRSTKNSYQQPKVLMLLLI